MGSTAGAVARHARPVCSAARTFSGERDTSTAHRPRTTAAPTTIAAATETRALRFKPTAPPLGGFTPVALLDGAGGATLGITPTVEAGTVSVLLLWIAGGPEAAIELAVGVDYDRKQRISESCDRRVAGRETWGKGERGVRDRVRTEVVEVTFDEPEVEDCDTEWEMEEESGPEMEMEVEVVDSCPLLDVFEECADCESEDVKLALEPVVVLTRVPELDKVTVAVTVTVDEDKDKVSVKVTVSS